MKMVLKDDVKMLLIGLVAFASAGAQAALPVQSWTARSGAKVLFVESRSIPMIDVNIDFDAGARYDSVEKAGLAALTQGLLGLGAGNLSEQEIADAFADAGAQRGGRLDRDRAGVSLRTLSSSTERESALAALTTLLAAPRFDDTVLAREKARRIAALKEDETKPEVIADRAFDTALYGDHPYGRNPSIATLDAITRADLQSFHAAHYGAKRAVVSMIGDLSRAQAEALAERITAALPPGSAAPALTPVPPQKPGETRIPHPATQSHILLGSAVLTRGDPDYFSLTVGNYILGGGGFVSRLMEEVREKRPGLQRAQLLHCVQARRAVSGRAANQEGAGQRSAGAGAQGDRRVRRQRPECARAQGREGQSRGWICVAHRQ